MMVVVVTTITMIVLLFNVLTS